MRRLSGGWAALLALCAAAAQGQSGVGSIEGLIRARDYDQALAQTKAALRGSPRDYRLWTLEGIALSMSGRTPEASKAFQTALSISPEYPAALRGEVEILYRAGDKRAIPLLERIIRQDAHDETAHEMLATLEEREGNCRAAIDQFAASGDAIASHPSSLAGYGSCLMQTQQPEQAVPVFEKLTALLPQQSFARYDLAVAQVEAKKSEAAIGTLEPMLAATPPDPDVLSLASDAYEAAGNTPKAVALLRQAIVLNPAKAGYYVEFAALCMSHESFQVGVDMLDVGLRHISGDPSLYLSRGLLYAQMAQFDKAEADFRMAEKLDSAQSLSAYAIDLADLQRNRSGTALSELRSQLKAHPQSPLLNYLLAKLLWSEGNQTESAASAEALRRALLAVKLKPDMVEARDLLGNIYIGAGRYDLAIEQCHDALEQDPSDQSAIYHLIVALRHTARGREDGEIPVLVKRLSALQQQSLQQETDRKRFSLVEQKTISAQ